MRKKRPLRRSLRNFWLQFTHSWILKPPINYADLNPFNVSLILQYYPENNKKMKHYEDSTVIHDFIEWLTYHKSIVLAKNSKNGWFPTTIYFDKLLAEYWDINLKEMYREQEEMLEEIRRQHSNDQTQPTKQFLGGEKHV